MHRPSLNLHGKEGVDGSSPSEGSAKLPHIRSFSIGSTCMNSSVRWTWSRSWSLQVEEGHAQSHEDAQFGAPSKTSTEAVLSSARCESLTWFASAHPQRLARSGRSTSERLAWVHVRKQRGLTKELRSARLRGYVERARVEDPDFAEPWEACVTLTSEDSFEFGLDCLLDRVAVRIAR
jgi:hypothetical protein